MKWCHRATGNQAALAIADSEGHITLCGWVHEEGQLTTLQSIACASEDILCLSLDWSSRRHESSNLGSIICSLSNGSLALLRSDSQELLLAASWHAHEFEPWIAAWDYWNENVVYSGGDDLKMKGWDIRQDLAQPTFINKRFDAGITTIQSHPCQEHVIAVGSYDNTVRIFDVRKPLSPLVQIDVGGGAWRVKWHPCAERKQDLLVACMHDGFKTVDTTEGNLTITKHYTGHGSLAYGADWSSSKDRRSRIRQTLVASCSFYDHALHLWYG